MARRFEHGKARPTPARRKDLPGYTAPEPDRNRGASGRFAPGNDAAKRKAIRSLLKRQLGAESETAEVEQLYRETMVQFRALLADLPANDAPEVQDLTARRARWSVLSARYASKAAELGLFTEEGAKLIDTALKLDARAERLAVTARDEAERLSKTRQLRTANATPWLKDE
ncbi:MAG TPA: hypothetical protein VER04_16135 [Polyangiaceae bacterium]|nr:hypothetical protein [Polyangiaceae bacterium]